MGELATAAALASTAKCYIAWMRYDRTLLLNDHCFVCSESQVVLGLMTHLLPGISAVQISADTPPYERYSRVLLRLGFGWPLWRMTNAPWSPCAPQIHIGDVGYLAWGRFCGLFNATSNESRRRSGDRSGFSYSSCWTSSELRASPVGEPPCNKIV